MHLFSPEFNEKSYIIFAVSGGPDSMAMLDYFKHANYKIVVAFVNYKKREESDLEQEAVKLYCHKNHLIFEPKVVEEKAVGNFQDWAREYRYAFFKDLYIKLEVTQFNISSKNNFTSSSQFGALVGYFFNELFICLETSIICKEKLVCTISDNLFITFEPSNQSFSINSANL